MILDYIGQELIWNLRGIHPYKPNLSSYHINIRCKNQKQNDDIKQHIMRWIEPEYIIDIKMSDRFPTRIQDISIRNAFGLTSTLHIINED